LKDLKARLKTDELGIAPSVESLALQEKALHLENWLPVTDAALHLSAHATLVGRKAEFSQLSALWRKTLPVGPARMVLLTGEPGIGKSNLVSVWQENLPNALFSVRHGHLSPSETLPTKLWAQLLRESLHEGWVSKDDAFSALAERDRQPAPRNLRSTSQPCPFSL
jgi:Cdc6-like AAA superfamily ATPase